MSPNPTFVTPVRDSNGEWPSPPDWWSYSSLREIEECPRRWALSRATYPGIWQHKGYPPRAFLPALLGDVIHRVLEIVLSSFVAAAVPSIDNAAAVETLRRLGGYSELARSAIDERLAVLADNPREKPRTEYLRDRLMSRLPEIRQRAQQLLSRTVIVSVATPHGDGSPSGRVPLGPGTYPEVDLRSAELHLAGRIDLLTVDESDCEITDYKTGAQDEHHRDQLLTYALLWSQDKERNPAGIPVRRLTLAYSATHVDVPNPDEAALAALNAQLAEQIARAVTALAQRPPPARPGPDICATCSVRHLCEDYWSFLAGASVTPEADTPYWFDYEGTVVSQNGPRSWLLAGAGDPSQLMVRTSASDGLPLGQRVRLLGLLRGNDPESQIPIASLTESSEVFLLDTLG